MSNIAILMGEYGAAAAPVPMVWSASVGDHITLSNGDKTQTFTSASITRSNVRTTASKNSGKRQVNLTLVINSQLDFGVVLAGASTGNAPGADVNGMAVFTGDGNIYKNNISISGFVGASVASGTYSMVVDFSAGTIALYNGSGTLIGSPYTNSFLMGANLFVAVGSDSAAVTGTVTATIEGHPTTLYGGAVAWDTA